MSKHTPGPWSLAYYENAELQEGGKGDLYTSVFSKSKFGAVAAVYSQKIGVLGECQSLEYETFEANAHLIASAPEMYEALKNLIDLHMCEQEGLSSGKPSPDMWFKAVDDAIKVLEKAEAREVMS